MLDRKTTDLSNYQTTNYWNCTTEIHSAINYLLDTINQILFYEIRPAAKNVSVQERYAGKNPDNSDSFAPQNHNLSSRGAPPTRESLIKDHNLDHEDPVVVSVLDKYDELKNNAKVPDFLPVIGGKMVAPFKRPKLDAPLGDLPKS